CRERILLKRIGVDGTAFRPWRDRPALGGSFTLISLCRIEPKKGLLELLEACALLRQRGRELRLRLIGGADPGHAGSADYAAAVRARVAELGLAGVVALEGAMASDDIPAAFGAAHGFVAPYVEVADGDKDGIPTAMVEAMAAGLPIVCTDAGAMREAVADGVEGLVVAQRDPVALAAAIGRLQDDAALRQRLGNAAAIRFDREFDCRITDEELHRRVREFVARSASGA
ncbi:MAG: glycosyltransferase, partial [Planctomycetes bacterium]|nr:glycosyltransferase [Planctomycetota bacterium]